MANEVRIFVQALLYAYEEIANKTCTEMALDFFGGHPFKPVQVSQWQRKPNR